MDYQTTEEKPPRARVATVERGLALFSTFLSLSLILILQFSAFF